ncbi:MAG: DUF72 domain-containing protein [Planctomycetes bacterium]|nr:DUF72 domain-containing protein [Planctomycetota bacterium]
MSAPDTARVGRFLYGTSSWSEKSWDGALYPRGTKPGDYLAFYARQFRTVEADSTYYAIPPRERVLGWRAKTPPGFVLAAKFPRGIVHGGESERPDGQRVLVREHVGKDTERFLDVMTAMGDKLGPLVLQFPYFNQTAFKTPGPFLERLDRYLDELPKGPRIVVEVRNKAWVAAPLLDCLKKHRAALALVDLAYMPHPSELAKAHDLLTSDFAYVRLIGDRKAVEAKTETFDRVVLDLGERLAHWAKYLQGVVPRVKETFAYANNHFAGHGPATIRDLARRMEREVLPLAPDEAGWDGR